MSRLIVLSASVLLAGCSAMDPPIYGSGKARTEKRDVTEFYAIELSVGSADLDVRKGDTASLELTWDDNLMPLVVTSVVKGVLKISVERNTSSAQAAMIRITVPKVSKVSVTGAGNISIEELSGPQAEISIAGSSDIAATVNADNFSIAIAGSGIITASGNSPDVAISISGSGYVDTSAIRADAVKIDIAGGGTVAVHAEKHLDVSIAGSGDISYSGKPQVKQSIAGSGSVTGRADVSPPAESVKDEK